MPESLLVTPPSEAVARLHGQAFARLAAQYLETASPEGASGSPSGSPTASLVAQCQQGQSLTALQLTTLGRTLGDLHRQPLDQAFSELSPKPFLQMLGQAWAVFQEQGPLLPLESAGQERLRQRFLDHHALALRGAAQDLQAQLNSASTLNKSQPAVVAHGGLSLARLGFLPDGRLWTSSAAVACALPAWWDTGCVLAWLPLLAHVSYSAIHYEPIVLKAYLASAPVDSPYDFLRRALPVAGLNLIALLLNDQLSWIKDIYLKEIFLKQALIWVSSPSQVDWLVQLPH